MKIAVRVVCLLVIAVVVYSLVYMSFIRQMNSDNRLQRPEDLEVIRRLKRIEDQVYKIGAFVLITYI